MASRRIFVGGLAQSVTDGGFRDYFAQYGAVVDATIMYDDRTKRSRGVSCARRRRAASLRALVTRMHENVRPRRPAQFGFITFGDVASISRLMLEQRQNPHFHRLAGKAVEIKPAEPMPHDAHAGGPGPSRLRATRPEPASAMPTPSAAKAAALQAMAQIQAGLGRPAPPPVAAAPHGGSLAQRHSELSADQLMGARAGRPLSPLSAFSAENGLDDGAHHTLLDAPRDVQERVLSQGPVTGMNKSAVVIARVRNMIRQREREPGVGPCERASKMMRAADNSDGRTATPHVGGTMGDGPGTLDGAMTIWPRGDRPADAVAESSARLIRAAADLQVLCATLGSMLREYSARTDNQKPPAVLSALRQTASACAGLVGQIDAQAPPMLRD